MVTNISPEKILSHISEVKAYLINLNNYQYKIRLTWVTIWIFDIEDIVGI